eukprot:CAMPEP_0185830720 /NCGR_PEP_ID=MMETSP1353-20130828/1040_1 /TAXON_ID=1077150 /ORGANISM="Erythrolobus australicus, Strain CCMP3124" /LENGTH=52 /DNA_ID=CAMNT_0028528687 /DNA_START=76 /DNA_END=234 /DNA_ORIENTATION=-
MKHGFFQRLKFAPHILRSMIRRNKSRQPPKIVGPHPSFCRRLPEEHRVPYDV